MKIIIDSKHKVSIAWIMELWEFRGLFYTLIMRDIKVRYKQTIVGILWAVLQPLILMFIFISFLGHFRGISEASSLPYPIFVFVGLLFWQFFSGSVSSSSNALTSNQALIQKIYVPRILLPFSKIGVFAIDFLICLGIIVILCFIYSTGTFLSLPAFIIAFLITVLFSSGLGAFFSSIEARYRDVRFIIPFFVQLFLFISPIIYPPIIFQKHSLLLYINPLTGAIDLARNSLTGSMFNIHGLTISVVSSLCIFTLGVLYFKKNEYDIADVI